MTEDDLLDKIANLARPLGWRLKHDRPARAKGSWRTAVQYDGQGWPDLFAVHHPSGDCIARELKMWTRRNELGRGQANWLGWLHMAGIDCGLGEPLRPQPFGVWTERDWDTIIVPRLLRPTNVRVA